MRASHKSKLWFGVIAAVAGLPMASPAMAAYTVTFEQVGNNLVATGSGSFNLGSLTFQGTFGGGGFAGPSDGTLVVGSGNYDDYVTSNSFGNFSFGTGSGGNGFASTGQAFGIDLGRRCLNFFQTCNYNVVVPQGYVSGTVAGVSTTTWLNTSFASFGLTPGDSVYAFGQGAASDTFTVRVESAVPEPSTWAMMLLGFGGIGIAVRRKRAPVLARA